MAPDRRNPDAVRAAAFFHLTERVRQLEDARRWDSYLHWAALFTLAVLLW